MSEPKSQSPRLTRKSFDAADRALWAREIAVRLLEAQKRGGGSSYYSPYAARDEALQLWNFFTQDLPDE